jgi:hypothetical protein
MVELVILLVGTAGAVGAMRAARWIALGRAREAPALLEQDET